MSTTMLPLLALLHGFPLAIKVGDPATPPPTVGPGGTPADTIRDIRPPMDFFPYLWWQVTLAVLALMLVLGLAIWLFLKYGPKPKPARQPTPREVALTALLALREQVQKLEAYPFSIAVSTVLRSFIEDHHHLQAVAQTTPEFLAMIAHTARFSGRDRQLLSEFLEQADMIKFARVEAGPEQNERLLESASTFVQGGPAV